MPTFAASPGTIIFSGRLQANADDLFLRWQQVAKGFYLNYFTAKDSLTHWWSCPHLGTNEGVWNRTRSATSYPKICARIPNELRTWAATNGYTTRSCKTCKPDEHVSEAASAEDYRATLAELSELVTPHSRASQPTVAAAGDIKSPPPIAAERIETTRQEFLRSAADARKVKSFYEGACQICGYRIVLPGGLPYAEAHHVWPLNESGDVGLGNLLCVCPNCHKKLDYRVERIDFTGLTIDPRHGFRRLNADYHNRKIDEQQSIGVEQRNKRSPDSNGGRR